MKMLRQIETERLRGSLGKLRIQLEAQVLESPADVSSPGWLGCARSWEPLRSPISFRRRRVHLDAPTATPSFAR
jgi:hypothetical protein